MKGVQLATDPVLEKLERDYLGMRVVAIGGGHGLAQALLAVQRYADQITAIVSVADDGGSSGRLVRDLGIPPPGDCRRALLALAQEPSPWRSLVGHRFDSGDVAGHSLGNLMLAGLASVEGGLEGALAMLGRVLGARGTVVPVAEQALTLEAVVDGKKVTGQVAVARARGQLTALRVLPADVSASPTALRAIATADQIVLGPGSLFTSVAAALMVGGMVEAVNASQARLVLVCNLTTQDGETLGMDAAAHLRELLHHTGLRPPGVVVANQAEFEVPDRVEVVKADREAVAALGSRLELAALADAGSRWPQHDPASLAGVLRGLA
jgi:uncharacterized cofD-like protein